MRLFWLLLLSACASGPKSSPSEPPPPAKADSDEPPGQAELEAAMAAARKNDLDLAIERAKAAIEKNPQLENAYLLYGSSCGLKQDLACESDAYQRGLESLPNSAALKKAMALVHLEKNEMDRAISMLEEVNDGKDVGVMSDLAYAYIFVNRIEDGEKLASKALQVDPKCFQCNMTLGQIHLSRKEFDKAISSYQAAIELEPQDPGPKQKLAQATYLAGKKGEAVSLYASLVESNADDENIRFEYAKVLLGNKDGKGAAVQIAKLLEKHPDDKDLLKLLLKAQQEAKDKKGTKETTARLKKLGVKP
jgi:tetratricopeptide (TPR) repeat protein